jgi:hypothetical protein
LSIGTRMGVQGHWWSLFKYVFFSLLSFLQWKSPRVEKGKKNLHYSLFWDIFLSARVPLAEEIHMLLFGFFFRARANSFGSPLWRWPGEGHRGLRRRQQGLRGWM